MRILLLSRSSNAGGGTTWCETIAKGLSDRGHQVRVIFTRLGTPANFMQSRLVPFVVSPLCYRYASPEWPTLLGRFIDSYQPTHIMVDNRERMREIATRSSWLAGDGAKIVFICHCHGVPLPQLEEVRPWLAKVVCVSEASEGLLRDYDTVVIRNAVNSPPGNGEDVRENLEIPSNAFVIGYVGRHDSNKSTGALFDLLMGSDWWLLMGGRNVPRPPSGMAAGAKDRMRLVEGEIANPKDWYRAMDVFVLPSKSEGFPLSPLEALLCNCRVAMTFVSDYPAMFANAIAFFPHGDSAAMREAIENAPDPELGQTIMREQLSVEGMLDQYEAAMLP
jgi:glycosyltransferase involved in cell wall biosynthesis